MNIKSLKRFLLDSNSYGYAGGGKYEKNLQRPGFFDLVYRKGNWEYQDSYTGNSRSGGQEVVRFKSEPVWWSGYGGGMIDGKDNLSDKTTEFLKKALAVEEKGFDSLRGPHKYIDGDWKYVYTQEGDTSDFYGREEIYYKGEKVFWHRAIGGIIKH